MRVTLRTYIAPSEPTPDDRRRMPLSDWDVVMFKSYTPILLFYPNLEKTPDFMHHDTLTESLRQALVPFSPLAGRLEDVGFGRDEIVCNDAGVLYQEAEYDATLESFRDDGYLPNQMDYHHMLPIHFYRTPSDPLLAIQVTRFQDGGVVLGVMMLHKVADSYSTCLFLDAWAKQARNTPYAKPTFDRTLVAVPPGTVVSDEAIEYYRRDHKVCTDTSHLIRMDPNQFKFSRTASKGPMPLKTVLLEFHSDGLHQCKKDAHTPQMIQNKIWLSTKDALLAMLLRAIVRCRAVPEEQPVELVMAVSGRSKMHNKAMECYFGNWMITRSVAMSKNQVKDTTLVQTAVEFRRQMASLNANLFHGISRLYTMHDDMTVHYLSFKPNSASRLTASDLSTLPFWRLDFGYGRPDRTRGYITSGGNGCLVLFGRSDMTKGPIYDVQLQMDSESMRRFVQDSDIKKYTKRIIC